MKTTAIGALATLAGSPLVAAVSQVNNPAKQEKYTSGAVMDGIMAKKYATWDSQKAAGVFDSALYPSYAGAAPVACVNGVAEVVPGDANNTFRCSNVSQILSPQTLLSQNSNASDRLLDRLL